MIISIEKTTEYGIKALVQEEDDSEQWFFISFYDLSHHFDDLNSFDVDTLDEEDLLNLCQLETDINGLNNFERVKMTRIREIIFYNLELIYSNLKSDDKVENNPMMFIQHLISNFHYLDTLVDAKSIHAKEFSYSGNMPLSSISHYISETLKMLPLKDDIDVKKVLKRVKYCIHMVIDFETLDEDTTPNLFFSPHLWKTELE
jgi:hypothetical protein